MQRKEHNLLPLIIAVSFCGLLLATLASAFNNQSSVKFDDVEIFLNGNVWKCDKIVCPSETERCHVSKENSAASPSLLVRKNVCLSKDGKVLLRSDSEEPKNPNQNVSLKIETLRGGSTSINDNSQNSVQVQQIAENYIRRMNQEIAQQMKDLSNDISSSFLNIF